MNGCEDTDKNLPSFISKLTEDDVEASPNYADMEDIFNNLGFGRWNTWFVTLVCLCQSTAPTQFYNTVFTNMPTDFRCEDNFTVNEQSNIFDNYCGELESMQNHTMSSSNSSYRTCYNYVYDDYIFDSTFTNEFHLICDKAWISHLFEFIFVLGTVFGNFFTGLSDKYGRAAVIKVSSNVILLGVLEVGFGFNPYIILFGRFLVGFCYPILNCTAYTLAMETTPTQYRSTVGIMVFIPYDLFSILLGLCAYYIRQWRMLHLLISSPVYPLPLIAMFLSESPRWLIQQGNFTNAYYILKDAAKKNGTKLASKEIVIKAMEDSQSASSYDISLSNEENRNGPNSIIQTLFASTKMKQIAIITPLLWILMSIVYFGVPLNANNFTSNPFMYMVMLGCVQLPMDSCGHFIIKKIGNIKSAQVSLFIIGISMLLISAIPNDIIWVKYIFVGITMILISLVCAICFIITSELFPTVNRSVGMGICSTFYYLGFLIGSLISNYLVDDLAWGFNVACGLCGLAAGFLLLFLPETQGKPLCETVDDVNNRTYKK